MSALLLTSETGPQISDSLTLFQVFLVSVPGYDGDPDASGFI